MSDMQSIEMTRGDTRKEKFQIKDASGSVLDISLDEAYVTVKNSFDDEEFLFQKKLTDGDITKSDTYYYFTIQPEDTDDLEYGTYVFDVQINYNNEKHTIIKGNLQITNEVTFASNE